jgi:DNA adenine methylase
MKVPHPIQYQGSKRSLASTILRYFPIKFPRLVEPFAGTAAISIACAARGKTNSYWINDLNKPLAELLGLIINHPAEIEELEVRRLVRETPKKLNAFILTKLYT